MRFSGPAAHRTKSSSNLRRRRALTPRLETLEVREVLAATFRFALGIGAAIVEAKATATDSSGNAYFVGSFQGTDNFSPGSGTATNLTSNGGNDIFVAKYTSLGAFVWARSFGGAGNDEALGVAVDSAGNVDVAGDYSGSFALPGGGGVALNSAGDSDGFVAQFTSAGVASWATSLGGGLFDKATCVTVDGSRNVYVAGYFSTQASFGSTNLTAAGTNDAFVAKLTPAGNVTWAVGQGGTNSVAHGAAIAVDGSGNVITTGQYAGNVNFDPALNPAHVLSSSAGSEDVYVSKLNSSGAYVWAQSFGGALADGGTGVGVDSTGNIYVSANFTHSFSMSLSVTYPGNDTGALLKFNANGGSPFVLPFLSTLDSLAEGIAVDGSGNSYVTGALRGVTQFFDSTKSLYFAAAAGAQNLFVAKYDSTGSLVYGRVSQSANDSISNGIAVVGTSNARVTIAGSYTGNAQFGVYPTPPAASTHAFLARLASVVGDFDGDGVPEPAVFRPSTGQWFINRSMLGPEVLSFGTTGDIPVPGDYDGDGITDLAVYRPSNAIWYILRSTAGAETVQFGQANVDEPVPTDYDGDGTTDLAVFRPTTAEWFIMQSTAGARYQQFGQGGVDRPVPADYDGDGKADVAAYRPTTAYWYLWQSTAGAAAIQWGVANPNLISNGEQPAVADYDGDGKADLTTYGPYGVDAGNPSITNRPRFFIRQSGTLQIRSQNYGGYTVGNNIYVPVPTSYDGALDGQANISLYGAGFFFIIQTGANLQYGVAVGQLDGSGHPTGNFGNDVPLTSTFDYRWKKLHG
jgi:FG-GAP-like repeat